MYGQQTPAKEARTIAASMVEARALTDKLFRMVRPESFYERPIPERHRILFYLGHLEAFDWNLIGRNILGLDSFQKEFDRLFAFGIDPVGGGLPSDQPSDWPSVAEVERYNRRVRQMLDAALEKASFSDPALPLLRDGYALHVALEHRLMHAETFAYMLHQLPLESKLCQKQASLPVAPPATPAMAKIPTGVATLGMTRIQGNTFGWDNEFESQEVAVPEFTIDVHNVTNRQFLDFMRAGGYEDRKFWRNSDWEWKEERGIEHPFFWTLRGHRWFYRAMFEEIPLPLDWPVYVSHAEASAYARWAGKELPTEAQFHRAAFGTANGAERDYPWGSQLPQPHLGNFDFERWDPAAVGSYPSGRSAFGVADLVGNGWEWTSTVFAPLPGFQAFPFYPGYSADFFDGKHFVIKGGSARTAGRLLRRSFRNWFQSHYPYLYAKFRCVTSAF
ncbi:MAG TPA: SUMF1/EgtB/PvdO family nonheme iron enzyme [Terriglobia bacterium]|nr:SUMF1/EgtB/PvdO family nonheme iron enzyme [Terriglobia bacterium]